MALSTHKLLRLMTGDSAGTAAKPVLKKSEDWLPSLVMFLLTHPKTKALSKVGVGVKTVHICCMHLTHVWF